MRRGPPGVTVVLFLLATGCTDQVIEPSADELGPPSLSLISGGDQHGYFGFELSEPLVVRLTQMVGRKELPVPNALVNFVPTLGRGSLFAGSALTSPTGYAQDYWTLNNEGCSPYQPCPNELEVRAVDPSTGEKLVYGTFEATGLPPVVYMSNCGTTPSDINDLGQMVVGATNTYPYLFKSLAEGCVQLPLIYAYAINNSGLVAGARPRIGSNYLRAAAWHEDFPDGGWKILETYSASDNHPGYALDVNEDGQITGYSWFANPDYGYTYYYGFVWTPSTGEVRRLGSLYSIWPSWGKAINDAGEVAGDALAAGQVTRAFFWRDPGEGEDPSDGMQNIAPLGTESRGVDINNAGQVVGYYKVSSDDLNRMFLWSEADGLVDFGLYSEACGFIPYAINDNGVVLGALQGAECEVRPSSFIWTESDGFQFGFPLGEDPLDRGISLHALNNVGQFAGVILGNGSQYPAVWFPPFDWF